MGYWGWRPLVCGLFMSVWVVGCSAVQEAAPTATPTQYPQITLTVRSPASVTPPPVVVSHLMTPVIPSPAPEDSQPRTIYIVQPGDTLLDIALKFGVEIDTLKAVNDGIDPRGLQIGQPVIIPNPPENSDQPVRFPTATPVALELTPPTCYSTPTDSLLCLGRVENRLDYAVKRVVIRARLLMADGTIAAEQETRLDQSVIPPGAAAPYHIQFNAAPGQDIAVSVSLQSAEAASPADRRSIPLVVGDEAAALENGYFVISATLSNPGPLTAAPPRLVVTLYAEDDHVAGYRVVDIDRPLAAGERMPVRVAVMPQTAALPVRYTLYVEAWETTGE